MELDGLAVKRVNEYQIELKILLVMLNSKILNRF